MTLRILALLLCMSLASCATVFSDSSDIIHFTSEPEGADVFVNGKKIGQTPISEKFDRDTFAKSNVQVKLAGYEEQRFILQKQLNKISLINFTFWPSWATDALSGSMIQYNPNSYHIFLKPEQLAQKYSAQKQGQDFVLKNYRSLLNDISRGDGEYLKSLWKMSFQTEMSYTEFLKKIEARSSKLLNAKKAPELAQALMQMRP